MARSAKSYHLNLVRTLRAHERRQENRRRIQAIIGVACFAVLALALAYSVYTIWQMEKVLSNEQAKLAEVQAEYNKYTGTRMIVEKGDVELLNALHGRGIFWTKKLAALANHLPDNYIISGFVYRDGELRVTGHGQVSPRQDQLLVLDQYLNRLRGDTTFSSVFREIHLNVAHQGGEAGAGRVGFEFSATFPGKTSQ